MARKPRRTKTIYLYTPRFNRMTTTTYRDLAEMLGVLIGTVHDYASKKIFVKKIQAYVFINKPTIAERRRINSDFVIENERWKETHVKGLYASNCGRFGTIQANREFRYILTQRMNPSLYVRYNNNIYSARNLIYTTFVGKIKEGNQIFFKNKVEENLSADNLIQMTFNEYIAKTNSKKKCKAVVFLDEHGEVIDEFKSTVEAAEESLYDRCTISRICKGEIKLPYTIGYANAFMWADEYYKEEGIC